jgi:hypothetical protein
VTLGAALVALLLATQADPEVPPEAEEKPAPEAPPEAEPEKEEPPPELIPAKPKPKPAAKPKPKPKPAAKPAPKAEPSNKGDPSDPHATKIRLELDALTPRSKPAELERVCGQWQPRDFAEKFPLLFARLQVCLVDAAERADRSDLVMTRLKPAQQAVRAAGPGLATRRLGAELRLYKAEVRGKQLLSTPRCAIKLGLPGLRRIEAQRLKRDLSSVVSAFEDVVASREGTVSRRALYRVALVYDRLDAELRTRVPETFRLVEVDDPFAWSRVRPQELLKPTLLGEPAWADEVKRTLQALEADADTESDLRKRVVDSLADIEKRASVYSSPAEAPWGGPPVGAIRYRSDGFLRRANDRWTPTTEVDARAAIAAQLSAGPTDPAWPFALVADVLGGGRLPEARWQAGLASDKQAARIATLVALTHRPAKGAYEPLLKHFAGLAPGPRALFATLADVLYGEREWTLRALKSIVTRDRPLARQITHAKQIPMDERVWLVAETGDMKLYQRMQEMQHGPERQQALAIYGAFRAAGERMAWMAKKGAPGLVGCVSEAVLDELADRKTRALEASAP